MNWLCIILPLLIFGILQKRSEQDKVFQLLTSLKPEYEHLKSQMLMGSDVPSLSNVCAIIQQEETRKSVMNTEHNSHEILESSALFVEQKRDDSDRQVHKYRLSN